MEDTEEKNIETDEPTVEFSDTKKILPRNFLLYSIALLWSFFLVFIFIYILEFRNQKNSLQNATEQTSTVPDSTTVSDSTQMAAKDSVVETQTQKDTASKFYVPPEGFLSTEDEMNILKLENSRRKREIDYLWNELRVLRKTAKELKEKSLVMDSTGNAQNANATSKTAQNFAELRQQQLEKERFEAEKQAKEQAEKAEKDKALANSVKIYSSMKPQLAATILSQFDNKEVAFMLLKLRDRQAAKILEQMDTAKAIQICKLMAK